MEKAETITIEVEGGSCLCTFYNNGAANIMVIDSVLVDEPLRRSGVGTKLINSCIAEASRRGTDCIELIVNDDNVAAKRLYEKCGLGKTNKEHYRLILNKWTT